MAIDFYNLNLHPITMFRSLSSDNQIIKRNKKKENYIKTDQLDGFISSIKLKYELGIGTKKIKALYASIGEQPKFNGPNTFYKSDLVPRIKELMETEIPCIVLDGFISNKELMSLFSLTAYQSWDISRKESLVKKRVGKSIYYEREKAIDTFSKYKR